MIKHMNMPSDAELSSAEPRHRIGEDILLDYASGSLPEGLSLAIATHASFSRETRELIDCLDAVGGVLLADCAGESVSDDCLTGLLDRLDAANFNDDGTAAQAASADRARAETGGAETGRALSDDPMLPSPLRHYVPGRLDDLPWRRIAGGVSVYELELSAPTDGESDEICKARLLRIDSGVQVPRHSHEGEEYTVVLAGGFHDGGEDYRVGDIAVSDGDVDHMPVAHQGETCICLAVTTAPLQLTGHIGRLLNPFVKF